jgi:hypothetical protein
MASLSHVSKARASRASHGFRLLKTFVKQSMTETTKGAMGDQNRPQPAELLIAGVPSCEARSPDSSKRTCQTRCVGRREGPAKLLGEVLVVQQLSPRATELRYSWFA